MKTDRKVLDLLYRQTAPEKILNILRRNLRGEPDDFLYLKDSQGKKDVYVEIINQPVEDKTHFLDYADTTLRGYSQDEHVLLFDQLGQRRTYWAGKGIPQSCGFLVPLIEFAEDNLKLSGQEPVCKYECVLEWRDAYLRLGQDLFVTAFLAYEDYTHGTLRYDFTWPVILHVDNPPLYEVLGNGMAENHNHLAGGTQSFQVTWCRMMNYPEAIREELVNFRNSNLYSRMHRGEKIERLDKFDELELAALVRTILFRALHRDEFCVPANINCNAEQTCAKSLDGRIEDAIPFDGRTAFAQEYSESFLMRNNLVDITECLKNAYGVFLPVLDKPEYCLDYAMEDNYLRAGKNQNIRLLVGERSFLYRCMRACLEKDGFTDFEKELFYLYMSLQCNFRSEMIQNNEQTGFMNFKNYQDRKDDAWDKTPYFCDAVCLALNNRLETERIISLEGRMVPKKNAKDNIEKVLRYDLAKRFMECNPEEVHDRNNYEFQPELDVDLFDNAPWFYVFHFYKVQDDRELESGRFMLPAHRHAGHRKLILDQARGFVEALRSSPYFRGRVRGIDAASDEVFCRPEIFAVAYRYIDLAQRKWNSSDNSLIPFSPIRINKTYHVGEDFLDIAGGLRAIDEAIRFLHMQPYSRIGHALALGVEPEIHYHTKNYEIITTKQERLDDLVWILYRGKELGVEISNATDAQLRLEADQLFREIYKDALNSNGWDSDLSVYWRSMKLRGDHPSVYSEGVYKNSGMDADEISSCLIDSEYSELEAYREDPQIVGLCYYYQYGIEVGRCGNETYVKKISHGYVYLMRRLQAAMIKEINHMNLIIETNPSSNVLIGTFKDYRFHPVFRFNNRKLFHSGHLNRFSDMQLNVCVNTDDLGVFDTTLEFEYALLYEALQKRRDYAQANGTLGEEKGVNSIEVAAPGNNPGNICEHFVYNDHDILDYLDDLRKIGIRAVFPGNKRG